MDTMEKPAIDLDTFTSLMEGFEESNPCEYGHSGSNVCSVEVTHRARATCNGEAFNICTSAANDIERRVQESIELHKRAHCVICKRAVEECWVVHKI